MESINIGSTGLSELGYSMEKEGLTVVLHSNNNNNSTDNGAYPVRFTIYKNDWNRTINKIEKKLHDLGFKQIIISAILKDMSDNYGLLMNGKWLPQKISNRKNKDSNSNTVCEWLQGDKG